MSQSLSKVYVHLTFSTKHRYPFIDDDIKAALWKYIGGICKGMECNPIRVGGHNDHEHILCLLSKKTPHIKLVEEVKKHSSKWIKTRCENMINFIGRGVSSSTGCCPVTEIPANRALERQITIT